MRKPPNRLIWEKSPYLLQHARNPVDWYPWGKEALTKAEEEDKLIFLSIGYSTCHWCHVMERESFEDEDVAKLLNRDYVAIKVDREERPDIDHIYMTACQLMTGHGGWPLTVVLTPEQKPIFAGTYFPKKRKWGRPGLMDFLPQITQMWQHERDQVEKAGEKITKAVIPHVQPTSTGDFDSKMVDRAFQSYAEQFDPEYGGFGPAPKFPSPHNLMFLFKYYRKTGKSSALEIVKKTLDQMYCGGMYDHIGFGFSRYATDEKWLVPHFEKMLYDNALLAYTYLEGYQVTGETRYANVAEHIFTYVLRDLTDPNGGFYSAEDADSEGVEGKFYVWTPEEVKEVLGAEVGDLVCTYYHITSKGNFEGKSIPHISGHSMDAFADTAGMTAEAWRIQLEEARKDDKILTAWNGLMIAALAKGAKVLQNKEYREAAEKAANFIFANLQREDGRLYARYREGEAAHPAYLDDYAFLVWGLHELYEATWNPVYLRKAIHLTEDMLRLFWDDANGGCYLTAIDGEPLLARPKEIHDGAIPSGNSVAAYNLLRLAHLTGEASLQEKAERQIEAFAREASKVPTATAFFLTAVQLALGPMPMIVIAGNKGEKGTEEMLRTVQSAFLPGALLLYHSQGEEGREIEVLVPSLRGQQMKDGLATAYICEDKSCQEPLTDLTRFKEQLKMAIP